MATFIYLNGPADSGKDVLANLLVENYSNVQHLKFSKPLRDAVVDIFGITEADFEKYKDHPNAVGRLSTGAIPEAEIGVTQSYRDFVIALSEKVLKPNFGHGYLGTILASDVVANQIHMPLNVVYVISDLGFNEELHEFLKPFKDHTHMIMQTSREGCSFNDDSRSYIFDSPNTIPMLHNDGTKEELLAKAEGLIYECIPDIQLRRAHKQ